MVEKVLEPPEDETTQEEISEAASDIAEAVTEIASDEIEEANERAETSERIAEALVNERIDDARERRFGEIEERISSWENRMNEHQTETLMRMEETRELVRQQSETLSILTQSMMSKVSDPDDQENRTEPETEQETTVQIAEPESVLADDHEKTETPPEAENPPEVPKSKKRRIRLL